MLKSWLSAAFISGLILFSCSIKEERSDCPGTLILDLSSVDSLLYDSLRVRVEAADNFLYNRHIHKSEYKKEIHISVPRTKLALGIYAGDEEVVNYSLPGLTIPYGKECYQVYMDNEIIFMNDEVYRKKVKLHKNFSILDFNLIHKNKPYPFDMELRGTISGYKLEGQPNIGKFSYTTRIDSDGRAKIKIPRQIDGSLELVIVNDNTIMRKFAIGEYIIESGFDWEKLDLEDVEIEINYTLTKISLVLKDWEKSFSIEVVI